MLIMAVVPTKKGKKADFYTARFARLFPAYLLSFLLFLPMAAEKFLWHPSAPQHRDVHTFVWSGVVTLFAVQAWTPLSQAWNGPASVALCRGIFLLPFPVCPAKDNPDAPDSTGAAVRGAVAGYDLANHRTRTQCDSSGIVGPLLYASASILASHVSDRHSNLSVGSAMALGAERMGDGRVGQLTLFVGIASRLAAAGAWGFSGKRRRRTTDRCDRARIFHPRCLSSRLMGGRVVSFLGGASYGIYILQDPIWHIWKVASDTLRHVGSHNTATCWQFLIYLALLGGIAILVQQTLERPAQRWLWQRRATLVAAMGRQPNREVAA